MTVTKLRDSSQTDERSRDRPSIHGIKDLFKLIYSVAVLTLYFPHFAGNYESEEK